MKASNGGTWIHPKGSGIRIRQISNQLTGSVVEVVVDLAETHIATSDLIGLQVGDVITTEKDVHLPLVVSIEGRPKFHAEAGVFKGRKAVQVKESISERPMAKFQETPMPASAPAAPAAAKRK